MFFRMSIIGINFFLGLVAISSTSVAGTSISLAKYQEYARKSHERCTGPANAKECNEDIAYGLKIGVINQEIANWSRAKGYYPVIDRRNKIASVCKCGCFAAGTKILAANSWIDVADVKPGDFVSALSLSSKVSQPNLEERKISDIVSGPEKTPLYVFKTDMGLRLAVTQHHGMVLANGRMKAAKDVKVGDAFVTVDGEESKVVSIHRKRTNKNVYNLEVDVDAARGHIVAAGGLLVGDLVWQNKLASELSRIRLRK